MPNAVPMAWMQGLYRHHPIFAAHGEGAGFHDIDGNFYTDLWVSYSRKIFKDRVGWKLQLNIENVTEGGRLMPTQVNFDGTPWAFRIIDSRKFTLTSTFNF